MTPDELKKLLEADAEQTILPMEWRHRTLNAVNGKETIPVKRRIPTVMAIALIMIALCSVALAAVTHAGLIDFVGRGANSYVPENAAEYIKTSLSHAESEAFAVNVKEGFFDGRAVHLVVDIVPKSKDVLVLGYDYDKETYWQDAIHADKSLIDHSDKRTIGDMFTQYKQVYHIALDMEPIGSLGATGDCVLDPETGILTVYVQEIYDQPMDAVEITLKTIASTRWENGAEITDQSRRSELQQTFNLSLDEKTVCRTFESREPILFEQVGVRVDKLRIEQRSMEIYTTLEYTVVDPEAYAKTDDGLLFEFIDPSSTAELPHDQRLKDGLTGFGSVDRKGKWSFVEIGTLGQNELHEVYTVRAYECWEKQRFDTCEIPVYEILN